MPMMSERHYDAGCTCREVRFRLQRGPLFVHCCHCRWCQRETGAAIHFIRIGTLDDPDAFPPDIHIFTSSKQPWVNLQGGAPAVPEYYDWRDYWSAESAERYRQALAK